MTSAEKLARHRLSVPELATAEAMETVAERLRQRIEDGLASPRS